MEVTPCIPTVVNKEESPPKHTVIKQQSLRKKPFSPIKESAR